MEEDEFDFSDVMDHINPANWGTYIKKDYSDRASFNKAYSDASEIGDEEFAYKGKRYKVTLSPDRTSELSFNHAFRKSRDSGDKKFRYKNKEYTTELVPKEMSDNYKASKQFLANHLKYGTLSTIPVKSEFNDPYSIKTETDNSINRDRKIMVNSLNKPAYFSITNQKGDIGADGFFNEESKLVGDKIQNQLFIGGDGLTFPIHELTHKAGLVVDKNDADYLRKIFKDRTSKKINASLQTDEGFEYVSDPMERAARHLSTKYYLNKNGMASGNISSKEYDKLYDDMLAKKLPYDIHQLMDLYGTKEEFIKQLNTPLRRGIEDKDSLYKGKKKSEQEFDFSDIVEKK